MSHALLLAFIVESALLHAGIQSPATSGKCVKQSQKKNCRLSESIENLLHIIFLE